MANHIFIEKGNHIEADWIINLTILEKSIHYDQLFSKVYFSQIVKLTIDAFASLAQSML
jgi:hypothetical protein